MGIWDTVRGSSLGREASRDMQQESTSPCQGARKGSRHPQRRQIPLRPECHVAPTPAIFFFCIKQKWQLLPLANIPWCPQKGLPLQSSHLTQGSLLAGQRAVVSAAEEWQGFFCLTFPFLLVETCWTCKRGDEYQYTEKMSWKIWEVVGNSPFCWLKASFWEARWEVETNVIYIFSASIQQHHRSEPVQNSC